MQLERKILSFKAETKSEGLQPNEFDGYASTFLGPVDSYGDIIAPGAFKNNLDFFLSDGVILREHEMECAIGKPMEAREDGAGLYIKGRISATSDGNDALILLRDEVIKRMSIGFRTLGYEMLSEARAIEVLGSEAAYKDAIAQLPYWSDGLRLLTDIKLYEVSLVAFPANTAAKIMGVKSMLQSVAGKIETERDFERFLRDAGFSQSEAKTLVTNGFKAIKSGADSGMESELADSMKALTNLLKG
jgi:HK97 family phage prohead protease